MKNLMYRMNDPDAAAVITGPCGDTMEIYLVIQNGIVTSASFFSEGCEATRLCGTAAAALSENKTIMGVLSISPAFILGALKELPTTHHHCAVLAVNTLHSAVAEYLLRIERS